MAARVRSVVGAALLVGCLLPAAWVAGETTASPALRIAYTGNLDGVLEPCGCQQLQPGGLARRPALLRQALKDGVPTALIDAGNNLPGEHATPEMLGFVLDTLGTLGYQLVNLGPNDVTLPPESLRDSAAAAKPSLISASKLAAGLRVSDGALLKVGAYSVGFLTLPHEVIDVNEARSELAPRIRRMRADADVLVAIGHLPHGILASLLTGCLPVDLILSTAHDTDLTGVRQVGRTPVLPCGPYGQALGLAEVFMSREGRVTRTRVTFRTVSSALPRDPAIQQAVREFYRKFASLQPDTRVLAETQEVLSGLLGSQPQAGAGCESCHGQQHSAWRETPHAHAWETLVREGASRRTDCIPCHVTRKIEAATLAPSASGVGCVTCHGGDPDHPRFPKDPRFIVRRPAAAVCRDCHRGKEDPHFAYGADLPLVVHGPGRRRRVRK